MLQQDEVISRLKDSPGRDVLNGEYVGELNLSGRDIDFCLNLTGARLVSGLDISQARLHAGLSLTRASVAGPVRAQHCQINGDAWMLNAQFAKQVDFSWTIVRGRMWGWRARFHDEATFFQLICTPGDSHQIDFVYAGELNFSWAWFFGKASFERGRFEGPVYFWRTRFMEDCTFNESSFARDATFMGKISDISLDRDEMTWDTSDRLEAAGFLHPSNEAWVIVDGKQRAAYYHLNNVNSFQEMVSRMDEYRLSDEERSRFANLYHEHAGPMFAKQAILTRMRFEQPKQIKFIGVNAAHWTFEGTDTNAIAFFNAEQQPVPETLGMGGAYEPVFISYGGPDEAVARRLHDALRNAGVTAYFYKDDALPGRQITDEMVTEVGKCKKVLFICSSNSPQRPGWQFELNQAFQRESKYGKENVAVPIAIDDGMWSPWPAEVELYRQSFLQRNAVDFRGALDNSDRFNQQLEQLLKGLRCDEPK
jgi:hypothetical protein